MVKYFLIKSVFVELSFNFKLFYFQLKVPEYDVTSPYQSNDEGHFVSYSMHQTRTKRSNELHDDSFYKLEAFGSELHLKLKRNEHLMAPDMKVLRENSDGTVTSHPAPENTFYLGQVASDPGSTVAVSNNGGLVSCSWDLPTFSEIFIIFSGKTKYYVYTVKHVLADTLY